MSKNKVLVLDIETNGFLDVADTVWMVVAMEVGSEEVFVFSDHAPNARPLAEAEAFVRSYGAVVAHNGYGFDYPAIQQLLGWELDWDNQKVIDTLIMSWMVDYKRQGGHSLGSWGDYFKFPKGDFKEFHQYSQEMLDYCIQDVRLNVKLYNFLFNKCKEIAAKKPLFTLGLKTEHRWAYYEMRMRQKGWKFNEHQARITHKKWVERMEEIKAKLEPNLRMRCLDKGELKLRRKKTGGFFASVTKYFDGTDITLLYTSHLHRRHQRE